MSCSFERSRFSQRLSQLPRCCPGVCLHRHGPSDIAKKVQSGSTQNNKVAAKWLTLDVRTNSKLLKLRRSYGKQHCLSPKPHACSDTAAPTILPESWWRWHCSLSWQSSRWSCFSANCSLQRYAASAFHPGVWLEFVFVDPASSSKPAEADPGLRSFRPQRWARNRLRGPFFQLLQQILCFGLGILILQMAQVILWSTIPISFAFQ